MFERMSASLDSIFTHSHRGLSVVVANNMNKDECLREYGLHVWHLVICMSGIMMYTGMSTCYALNGRGMKYTLKTRPKNIFVADTVCGEKYSCGAILFHVTELLLM